LGIGHQPKSDTYGGYTSNINQDFPSCDFGPISFYDSTNDWSNANIREYFYDSAYTDGYVDGGADGTAGGAPQPDIYLKHNGSGLTNGGSITSNVNVAARVYGSGTFTNATASWSSPSSGTITVISNTDGPGSGGTR